MSLDAEDIEAIAATKRLEAGNAKPYHDRCHADRLEIERRDRCLALAVQLMGPCTHGQDPDYEGAAAACTEIAEVFKGYIYGPAVPAEPKSDTSS